MDRNYIIKITKITPTASLSARRAWIEIGRGNTMNIDVTESLSARRAWIEIVITAMTSQISVSLSARRAWIEIAEVRP